MISTLSSTATCLRRGSHCPFLVAAGHEYVTDEQVEILRCIRDVPEISHWNVCARRVGSWEESAEPVGPGGSYGRCPYPVCGRSGMAPGRQPDGTDTHGGQWGFDLLGFHHRLVRGRTLKSAHLTFLARWPSCKAAQKIIHQSSPPRTGPGYGRRHAWGQRGRRQPDPRPRRAAAARRQRLIRVSRRLGRTDTWCLAYRRGGPGRPGRPGRTQPWSAPSGTRHSRGRWPP